MAASLTDDQLAIKVRDGLAAFRPQYDDWRPFAIELHARFEARKNDRSGKEILGCRTWEEFCEQALGYSTRHVRRLMGADNPAGKYRNKTRSRNEMERSERSAVGAHVNPTADWSDAKYIDTCVRFVASTLKPVESDPPRFHRLAVAIAKAIAGDFLQDDQSGFFGFEKAPR